MKYPRLRLILIISFLCISCEDDNVIVGSGNIVSENRSIASFTQIEAGAAFNILVSQGNDESLTVEADDNIIDLIATEVSNNRLRIRFTQSDLLFSSETLRILIKIPELRGLELKDASSCEVDNFQISGDLEVVLKDDADLIISGDVGRMEANLEDAAKLLGFSFEVADCSVALKDASNMEIWVSSNLEGSAKDASVLRYKGFPRVSVSTEDAAEVINAN